MPNIRKERVTVTCQNRNCSNTFEVMVDSKRSQKYCCRECALTARRFDGMSRRMTSKIDFRGKVKREAIRASDLQEIPVNLGQSSGKFIALINKILKGEVTYIGVS